MAHHALTAERVKRIDAPPLTLDPNIGVDGVQPTYIRFTLQCQGIFLRLSLPPTTYCLPLHPTSSESQPHD